MLLKSNKFNMNAVEVDQFQAIFLTILVILRGRKEHKVSRMRFDVYGLFIYLLNNGPVYLFL